MQTDLQLGAVRLAFDRAMGRMAGAGGPVEAPDELSNALHHTYRLGELSRRWGGGPKKAMGAGFPPVPGLLGALWIRCFDTHDLATVATAVHGYPLYYGASYGAPVWRDWRTIETAYADDQGRHEDYQEHLQERDVTYTLRIAFDGLAAQLQAHPA